MRWARLVIIASLVLIFQNRFSYAHPGLAQNSPEPIIKSNQNGLSLTWTPPAYNLSELETDGKRYSKLQMPGTTLSGKPGQPQLPIYSRLIGLPPSGEAQLRVVDLEWEVVQLAYPPLPAPTPQPIHISSIDPQSMPAGGPVRYRPDPDIYGVNTFYPPETATLGSTQQVRHQRVVPLTISPLRVNPVTKELEIIRYLRLDITFDQPAATTAPGLTTQSRSDAFTQALASTLINPEATNWSVPTRSATLSEMSGTGPSAAVSEFKIIVHEAGLYQLTYNDLLNAGIPVGTLNPHTLKLSHGWPRQEVAIRVKGEEDYQFNTDDYILFYAEPEFSRFVNYDVYFLSYGQVDGLRMGSQPASPDSLAAGTAWRVDVAEKNQHYDSHYAGRDGDYWYWEDLRRPGNTSGTYTIELDSPLSTGPSATLTVWLQGYTDPIQNPDHRVSVSVNGTLVGETTWDGAATIAATFTVPAADLQHGANQVTISLPGSAGVAIEGTWLDAIFLTYPINRSSSGQLIFQGEAGQKNYTLSGWPDATNLQIYNITDPLSPYRLTDYDLTWNGTSYTVQLGNANAVQPKYLIVSDDQILSPQSITPALAFDNPPTGADYIIITHANFAGAVLALAQHRAAQGLRVSTVDVQTVYDTYGPGRMDPEAIKNFLTYAFSNWPPPAPSYVLLVGDGSYDFKNYSGYNPQTFIPPYLAHVDPWWGETAADNQFVTLSGDDLLPEMLIGRFAVTTPAETRTVVDKIIRYETSPVPGDWNARHIFVADEPDGAINFHDDSDRGYALVQTPFRGQRFYLGDTEAESHLYTNVDRLRTDFLNTFNQGAGMVTFHGHGSWLQWAKDGILRYYPPPYPDTYPNDLAAMDNQERLPVVLEMTCFTGSFHRPEVATVDESLLNLAGGGAVAVWGSTGLGISSGHVALQTGFYESVNQGESNVGAATLAGKMRLSSTGLHQDLLDTFTLFGDPALHLNLKVVPYSEQVYLPLIQR